VDGRPWWAATSGGRVASEAFCSGSKEVMTIVADILKTEKKLCEAKFFLAWLQDATRGTNLEKEDFEFYLSALLNAGRSVTLFLQVEQKDSYDAFFEKWKAALKEDDRRLLTFMNEQRRAEVHTGGADVYVDIEMVPLIEVQRELHGHALYFMQFFDSPGTPQPEIGKKVHYFQIGDSREKALDTCKRYILLLEGLVHDFRQMFPETAPKRVP